MLMLRIPHSEDSLYLSYSSHGGREGVLYNMDYPSMNDALIERVFCRLVLPLLSFQTT